MPKFCSECSTVYSDFASKCKNCGSSELRFGEPDSQEALAAIELEELRKTVETISCFTTELPLGSEIIRPLGIVLGTSSKQAFWGLSTQADRIGRAYDAALANLKYDAAKLGANAVVGIKFALNNSTGSAANLITGSSEAVMLLGTAVELKADQ